MAESTDEAQVRAHIELFKKLVDKKLFKAFASSPTSERALEVTRILVLTYRYHATPQTFVEVLSNFYNTSKKKGRGKLVQSVLTEWVRVESQRTLKRAGVIDDILELLGKCAGALEVNKIKLQLLKAQKKQPQVLNIDGSNFDVLRLIADHKPRVLAKHMTAIDWEFFSGIEVKEIVFRAWQGDQRHARAPTLSKLAERFDRVSFWIATCILSQETDKDRCAVIKYFIRVMGALHSMRNFNSLMMCLSGLNMSVVQRLKASWEGIKARDRATFDEIDELMTPVSNMGRYREALTALEAEGEPVIPYVAMYLRDVTYVFDGNPDFIGEGKKLEINFEKMQLLSVQLGRLKNYQQQKGAANFVLAPGTRDEYVFAITAAVPNVEFNEEVLYEKSLAAQPLAGSAPP